MLKKVTLFAVLLGIGIFGATFASKNSIEVSLRYYFNLAWDGPLVIALLAALVIGFFLGLLTGFFRLLALRRQLRRQRVEQALSHDGEAPSTGGS